MNTRPWLSDHRPPSGKKARLQRILCRHVLGDDTAMILACQFDKSLSVAAGMADIARRNPCRRDQPW
ncbi:hypothetical protein MCHLDSM_03750 [Mycolicibacterium chlorophenolicum]|uniref:Uncharacterized protein n=1 Tax=Mycolicibacterium chlorophenolicum TaxID=37916 RepID=A0A0J6YNN5_9MYCO|nr:hypothetical protein MCHLDSM_03750 [Mycolicibacterium chlorophenolicum]